MKRVKETALVICGIVIGITLTSLFRSTIKNGDTTATATPSIVKKLEEKTAAQEKQVQARIDAMNHKNILLQAEVEKLKDQLTENRIKSRKLQVITNTLAKKKTAVNDTALLLADCDTLKEKVVMLNRYIEVEEGLCDSIMVNQQQQLLQKDSVIALDREQYVNLRNSFAESIMEQKLLLDQNTFFKKQIRKQKIKSKIISGLSLVAAGITTRLLLR